MEDIVLDDRTLIIFDSNVWLDLYKLPPTAIVSVVEAIDKHKSKFWLPHQVYVEFNRHVNKKRDEALEMYKKIQTVSCDLLSDTNNKINQEFENLRRNNIFDAVKLQDNFNNKIHELASEVKKNLEDLNIAYQKEIKCISKEKDIILELIEFLHKESKTNGFKIKELIKIYEEGEIRYKYKVAPGYTDAKKKEFENDNEFLLRKYGDLIIWKEILNYVQGTYTNLLFIENEKKSDWWESSTREASKILIQEYQEVTDTGSNLKLLNFEQLLNQYGIDLDMPASTVKDIIFKLKFEKRVYEYLNNNKDNIIQSYIEQTYFEDERIDELLQDLSVFGGTIESVDDLEILNIKILESSVSHDKDWDLSSLVAKTEIQCTAQISEYVNKYVHHSGTIRFKLGSSISLDFSIDFNDLRTKPENAYEIINCEIFDEELIHVDDSDFDIDIDFDEDMYRDR